MKTAIMFSGQGGQCPGMMQDIFEQYPVAMETFRIGKQIYGRDLYSYIAQTSQEELNETKNTQPCLVSCQLAALRVLRMLGIKYDGVLGFSLGEWSALAACDIANEADILSFVEKRAEAMQKAVPIGKGGMAVVLGKDEAFVEMLCRSIDGISPANYNCPGNISVAGRLEGIDRLLEEAEKQKIVVQRLAISIPSHCGLMNSAKETLSPLIEAIPMRTASSDFVMNATAKLATTSEQIKQNLVDQLILPVRFQQSVELMLQSGYDTFIEIGPGKSLTGMVKRIAKSAGKKVTLLRMSDRQTTEELVLHFKDLHD